MFICIAAGSGARLAPSRTRAALREVPRLTPRANHDLPSQRVRAAQNVGRFCESRRTQKPLRRARRSRCSASDKAPSNSCRASSEREHFRDIVCEPLQLSTARKLSLEFVLSARESPSTSSRAAFAARSPAWQSFSPSPEIA
eukprot:601810-Pyramimonas_sp.AAC.1